MKIGEKLRDKIIIKVYLTPFFVGNANAIETSDIWCFYFQELAIYCAFPCIRNRVPANDDIAYCHQKIYRLYTFYFFLSCARRKPTLKRTLLQESIHKKQQQQQQHNPVKVKSSMDLR